MIAKEKNIVSEKTTIVLRSASKNDCELLYKYSKDTAEESLYITRDSNDFENFEAFTEYISSFESAKRSLFLLMYENGELLGSATLCPVSEGSRLRHRCVTTIALYENCCGKGLGKILFNEILCTAKALGFEQAELQVAKENLRAIAFYKKFGYAVTGEIPKALKTPEGYKDNYIMAKEL